MPVSTADALTLLEKFEQSLEKYSNNLARAAVELAKDWRTDRALRKLEALLIVADREQTLLLSGTGNVVGPTTVLLQLGQAEITLCPLLGRSCAIRTWN